MAPVTWSLHTHYCNHCSRVRREGGREGGMGEGGRKGGGIEQSEGVSMFMYREGKEMEGNREERMVAHSN